MVLEFVLSVRDMNPEVVSVGGFDDGFVVIRVGLEP